MKGWMIERAGTSRPMWWFGDHSKHEQWTYDPNSAAIFPSQSCASVARCAMGLYDATETEHVWVDGSAAYLKGAEDMREMAAETALQMFKDEETAWSLSDAYDAIMSLPLLPKGDQKDESETRACGICGEQGQHNCPGGV